MLDAYAICEVEDACRPDLNQRAVVVELASAPKLRSEVYGQEKVLRLSVPPSASEPPPVNPPVVLMVTEELASWTFGRAVVRESELSVVVPVIESVVPVALRKSKSVMCEVELAVNPLVSCRSVVVELVLRPYCAPGVNGNICASELLEILLLNIV